MQADHEVVVRSRGVEARDRPQERPGQRRQQRTHQVGNVSGLLLGHLAVQLVRVGLRSPVVQPDLDPAVLVDAREAVGAQPRALPHEHRLGAEGVRRRLGRPEPEHGLPGDDEWQVEARQHGRRPSPRSDDEPVALDGAARASGPGRRSRRPPTTGPARRATARRRPSARGASARAPCARGGRTRCAPRRRRPRRPRARTPGTCAGSPPRPAPRAEDRAPGRWPASPRPHPCRAGPRRARRWAGRSRGRRARGPPRARRRAAAGARTPGARSTPDG